jgi:hypothetical protein
MLPLALLERAASAEDPTDAAPMTAERLLSRAEAMMTEVDYARAREFAERAIAIGGLDLEQHTRAYQVLAIACAQSEDDACARRAFTRLLVLDPESKVDQRLSPERRTALLDARGFWSAHRDGFGIVVRYGRRERRLFIKIQDALAWGKKVRIWTRSGIAPYTKVEVPASPDVVEDVGGVEFADALDVYVSVVDEHDNMLLEFGQEVRPHIFGLTDAEFAEIRRNDIRGGETGSFARRLEELGGRVSLHGYASLEFSPVEADEAAEPFHSVPSFDLHHATLMARANLSRAVSVEIALEWEHLGREAGAFYLPHAFIDAKANDALVLRAGFFEAPIGAFNEYLYPDFLRITALAPLFSQSVVPALWSEVGLQLRGKFPLGRASSLSYAAFVSNGLEQRDPDPNDGLIAEGGDLYSMRFNARDEATGHKGFGGRAGVALRNFDIGASAYTGRYTVEGARRLSILDGDASYRDDVFTLRAEGALTLEETTTRLLRKRGMYTLVAIRAQPAVLPYLQYDLLHAEGDQIQRVLAGLALYPYPRERATSTLRLKSEAGFNFPKGEARRFIWYFQLTTGF